MEVVIASEPTATAFYHLALIEKATNNNEGAATALERAFGLGLSKSQLCPFEQRQLERLSPCVCRCPKTSGLRKVKVVDNSSGD